MVIQNIPYNCYKHVKKEKSWTAGNLYIHRYYNNNIYWSMNRGPTTLTLCTLWLTQHNTPHHTVPQQTSRHRTSNAITSAVVSPSYITNQLITLHTNGLASVNPFILCLLQLAYTATTQNFITLYNLRFTEILSFYISATFFY